MSGTVIMRRLLVDDPAITALVPADSIIADEAFPQGFALPGVLIRSTDTTADKNVRRGARRHVFERVSVEIHCDANATRAALKKALRNAGDQKFPTRDGLENIVVEFLAHVADGMSTTTFVRMAETDFRVSWSEPVT